MRTQLRALPFLALAALLLAQGAMADAPRCEPRGLASWRAKCVSEPDVIRRGLEEARRTRTFASVDDAAGACRVLSRTGGDRDAARAHFLAVLLDVGTGRLDRACCYRTESGERLSIGDAIHRADSILFGRGDAACAGLLRDLRPACGGSAFVSCSDADSGSGHSGSSATEDTHDHGKGAEHGKGHEEHGQGHGYGHYKDHGDADDDDDDKGDCRPAGACCEPKSADWWEAACARRERMSWAFDPADAACMRDISERACDVLTRHDESMCARARRQFVALRLNIASGRLSEDCRLACRLSVTDVADRCRRHLREGRCEEALELLRDINTNRGLMEPRRCRCAGSADDDHGDHDDDDDDHDEGHGKDKSKDKGKSKGKKS